MCYDDLEIDEHSHEDRETLLSGHSAKMNKKKNKFVRKFLHHEPIYSEVVSLDS